MVSEAIAEPNELPNVSKSSGKSDLAQLHVVENDVYVIWRDNSPGNDDIYFAKSSNGGASFDEPLNISNNSGGSAFPRMAVSANNIYSAWYDYTTGQSDIFFAKSSDSGNSFETVNLSNNGGVSYNPWVAAYDSNVLVVWNDETPQLKILNITKPKNIDVALGSLDILLATSKDNGTTFEISNISNTPDNSWNPRIAIYENNVYVVWNEKIGSNDEIFFTASTDGAKSFSKPVNLSMSGISSIDAGIEAFGNNVYVIWQEALGNTSDIFFAKSENNGASFSNPVKISNDGASGLTRDTQMVALENNVSIVWFDKSSNSGVFFIKSDDYGETFSDPINLSGKVPNPILAQIAGVGDSLYVIWQDSRLGNSDIFLRKSHDNGQSFGSIINLSNDISESNLSILGPQISTVGQNIFTVFEKIDENGSDLFLHKVQDSKVQNGTMILQTINGAVNAEIGIDLANIESEIPIPLTLKFFDPVTGDILDNVNYSFSIEDVAGNIIYEQQDLLAQYGTDTLTVTFPERGTFTITINVKGLGETMPYDDSYSGMASAVITVIPEFPIGVIGVVMFGIVLTMIISKFQGNQLSRKTFI